MNKRVENILQKYLENSIVTDFLIVTIIFIILYYFEGVVVGEFRMPSGGDNGNFIVSLITVSATLLGFLLTVITVIVTFKSAFEKNNLQITNNEKTQDDNTTIPTKTVFDRKISKEERFFGSPIHKHVINVFANATFEIGFVLISLLIMQFNSNIFNTYTTTLLNLCFLVAISLSLVRSLYIFKLFLNIHILDSDNPK